MVYVDTSVLVTLYVREAKSRKASDWIRGNNKAIPKTMLHELEFTNAIRLKQFRHEMIDSEAETIFKRLHEHETAGIYFTPVINWPDLFYRALTLSKKFTGSMGSRSLDILHVALAELIEADRFFTFDVRQSQLAQAVGLKIVEAD